MRKRIQKRIPGKKGFTLAETLITILILLMATAIIAAGIPVAVNAYEKIVLASNAQTLLSTTITRLRDELGTATNITVADDKRTISYTGDTGRNSRIHFDAGSTGGVYLTEYADAAQGLDTYEHRLVTEEAATKSLYAVYGDVTYDKQNGILTVENLEVKAIADGKTITEMKKIEIWILTDRT